MTDKCKFCEQDADEDYNLFRKYYQLNHYNPATNKHYCETVPRDNNNSLKLMDIDSNICKDCTHKCCYVCLKEYDNSFIDIEFEQIQFDIANGEYYNSYYKCSITKLQVNVLNNIYEKYKDQYVCVSCFPYMFTKKSGTKIVKFDDDISIIKDTTLKLCKYHPHHVPSYINPICSSMNYLMTDYYTFKKQIQQSVNQNTEHIRQNTEHIKQNTEHIKQNTEHIKQNTEHIRQNTLLTQQELVDLPEDSVLDDKIQFIKENTEHIKEYTEHIKENTEHIRQQNTVLTQQELGDLPEHSVLDDKIQFIKQHSSYLSEFETCIDTLYSKIVTDLKIDLKTELNSLIQAKNLLLHNSLIIVTPLIKQMVDEIDQNIIKITDKLKLLN